MASAQVVETSVANNSPSQDSNHPDDLFQSRLTTDVKQMLFLFLDREFVVELCKVLVDRRLELPSIS